MEERNNFYKKIYPESTNQNDNLVIDIYKKNT